MATQATDGFERSTLGILTSILDFGHKLQILMVFSKEFCRGLLNWRMYRSVVEFLTEFKSRTTQHARH
jgi:hypothetical protein